MYATLALALAAAASALPSPPPSPSKFFSLAMKVDGSYVSLNAAHNGTAGEAVLQAQRLSVYPGTPAYLNGTGDWKALDFEIDGQSYGVGLPEVGNNYGHVAPAFARIGYQEFEWAVYDGKFDHKRDAALNQFYACKDTLQDGSENFFLKWGTENFDGSLPEGCSFTEVIQNCNVEGGLKC